MKRRRVKITGIGPVTPAGIGREAFWRGIQEPVSRVRRIDRFLPEAGAFVGAEVPDFRLEDFAPEVSAKRMPRHTQFALAGAILAAQDAGLELRELGSQASAVVVGAALMDFGAINRGVEIITRRGPVNGLPSSVSTASVSSIGGVICDFMGQHTKAMALQSACCSGLDAIGYAVELIATGRCNMAVAGGTECPMFFHPMLELKLAGLAPGNPEAPEKQSRPFDLWRTTGVIGEGACMFIIEPEESPRAPLAFVEGYAYSNDYNGELCSGLVDAVRSALINANRRPSEVSAIYAWGPGHKAIDRAEAAALHAIFEQRLGDIAAVSIKGAVGNPLAAAGAMQVAAAILGLNRAVVPPTVNWEFFDPACPLGLSNVARYLDQNVVIVNSHGVSGTNACLVMSQ